MNITQSVDLTEKLVKAKIPQKTVTELLDFIESQKTDASINEDIGSLKNDVQWLKWIVTIGFTAMLTIIVYLHSDTNKRMDKIEGRMDRIEDRMSKVEDRMGKIEDSMGKIEAKLDILLNRK